MGNDGAADPVIREMRRRFATVGEGYGEREQRLVELAASTRELIQEVASTSTDPATVAEATELVRQAAALLQGGPHERAYFGVAEGSLGDQTTTTFFDYSPFVGPLSPLSPPLRPELIDDRVVARVTYQRQYEGPPGCLHGGLIAAGFDEVLGFAQTIGGRPGMTGRLEVTYRSPTPLFEEVVYEGRLDRVEGRKIYTVGTLHAGDRLCAEATGLFISFRQWGQVPGDAPASGPFAR
jgi:acyl-coenzyme A thioesterase PaaI-like protein